MRPGRPAASGFGNLQLRGPAGCQSDTYPDPRTPAALNPSAHPTHHDGAGAMVDGKSPHLNLEYVCDRCEITFPATEDRREKGTESFSLLLLISEETIYIRSTSWLQKPAMSDLTTELEIANFCGCGRHPALQKPFPPHPRLPPETLCRWTLFQTSFRRGGGAILVLVSQGEPLIHRNPDITFPPANGTLCSPPRCCCIITLNHPITILTLTTKT